MDMEDYLNFLLLEDLEENLDNEDLVYNKNWYNNLFNLPDKQFKDIFRMTKEKFLKVKDIVFSKLPNRNIDDYDDLLVFIAYVSHHSVLRLLREQLGCPVTSIFNKIKRISDAILGISHEWIRLPDTGEFESLSQGFYTKERVAGTLLSIDGTHIPITAPKVNKRPYFNIKHFYSLNALVAVDFTGKIRFISTGYGSSHDSRIYRVSDELRLLVEGLPEGNHIFGNQAFKEFRI